MNPALLLVAGVSLRWWMGWVLCLVNYCLVLIWGLSAQEPRRFGALGRGVWGGELVECA